MFKNLKRATNLRSMTNPVVTEMPTHWGVRSMRSLIRPRSERNRSDLPLLSVARERGVFVRSAEDDNHNVVPDDLTNYKVARHGDLVINKMKAWQGSLGLAPVDGIVSPAYYVYDFALENRLFGQALLRSKPYVALLAAASDGVRVGQWDLSVPRLREVPVLIPPADEQAAIVKYLGHAHARIDRAIAAKRKLIALLEEQKRAMIHEAVTRGLDPSVPFKDSGTPWLGEIPAHWDLVPTRSVLCPVKTVVGERQADYQLLSLTLGGVIVRDVANMKGKFATDQSTYQAVSSGQFVFCLFDVDETPRTIGLSRVSGMITGAYRVFDCADSRWSRFAELYFLAMDDKKAFRPLYTGLRKTVPLGAFLHAKMPLPPRAERDRIVKEVQELTLRDGVLASRVMREIELLREFRTRLTSDVVTGQVDVREIAATLPVLSDDGSALELDDELEELLEGELEPEGVDE